jgi:hypothetical protein
MAAARRAPSRSWTPEATLGASSSPMVLPTRTRSSASAEIPAQASARAPATTASSPSGTCETRRSFIPVRVVIHSSSVSRKVARSALVSTAGGRHFPQPVMAACGIVPPREASGAP